MGIGRARLRIGGWNGRLRKVAPGNDRERDQALSEKAIVGPDLLFQTEPGVGGRDG
jgi:hypothetical protein